MRFDDLTYDLFMCLSLSHFYCTISSLVSPFYSCSNDAQQAAHSMRRNELVGEGWTLHLERFRPLNFNSGPGW